MKRFFWKAKIELRKPSAVAAMATPAMAKKPIPFAVG
jgi:hypothetical protein